MNTKNTLSVVGLLAAGALAAQGLSKLTASKQLPNMRVLKLVNVKFVREDLSDGGVQWNGRACGYEQVDGGTVAEPCWPVTVTRAEFAPLAISVLDQKR